MDGLPISMHPDTSINISSIKALRVQPKFIGSSHKYVLISANLTHVISTDYNNQEKENYPYKKENSKIQLTADKASLLINIKA